MKTASHKRRVFSIPSGVAFLPAFTQALLSGQIVAGFPNAEDPFSLSQARIFVPTRRAARALIAELARRVTHPAVLLPAIIPLGAMDESETASLFEPDSIGLDHPGVVSDVRRRLVLTKLILAWSKTLKNAIIHIDNGQPVTVPDEAMLVTSSPAQAYALAHDLGALLDELTISGIEPHQLKFEMPEGLDRYWDITLHFLKIAFEQWPAYLAQQELQDRAQRQLTLVNAEIRRLEDGSVTAPQIVIGSTGTNSATAKLISAIAAFPHGAVILPGLDAVLDKEGWAAIGGKAAGGEYTDSVTSHPQSALCRLLSFMNIDREDVAEIGALRPEAAARMDLVREALRPAETTDHWAQWKKTHGKADISAALADLTCIDADDERTEALAIAIALRRALLQPDITAALVTPDRNLARRVRAELQRWGIDVDDSGGDPVAGEPAGILATLALQCSHDTATAADMLALLHHSGVRLGYTAAHFAKLRAMAEIAVLRGPGWSYENPGASLEAAREDAASPHAHAAKRSISGEEWTQLADFFTRFQNALLPLRNLSGERPLVDWFTAHRSVLELLKASAGDEEFFHREDDLALNEIFESFMSESGEGFTVSAEAYASLFATVTREAIVRGPRHSHPRLKILGLLEARLMNADLMILGGLDESIWPPAASSDPFLNRPMRVHLGLPSPERRIGQTAHDFVEAAGSGRVILTRSKKRGDAPSVPSRFIQRLAALAGDAWQEPVSRGKSLLALANIVSTPDGEPNPVKRPEPKPPLELRPQSLTITQIETWRRDPYSIYARHILKLQPLEEPDEENDASDFGSGLHDVLAKFHECYPAGALPPDAGAKIIELAETIFADQLIKPDFRVFRWPAVVASLHGFIVWETGRRENHPEICVEQSGSLIILLADGSSFRLRGRADRLEIMPDGSVIIIDYKSGTIPGYTQINDGFAPQLTLEAAMIERGAFMCVRAPAKASEAYYVKIGSDEDIEQKAVGNKTKPFDILVSEHFAGLIKLADQFRKPCTPYIPRPVPQYENKYAQYDHLARVKEWSSLSGEEES